MHLKKICDVKDYCEGRVFLASTQNLSYIPKLSKDHAHAFTILGSGDSVFQLAYQGVQEITAAEANSSQITFYHLRRAAVEALSYNEFCDFLFHPDGQKFLSPDLFFTKLAPIIKAQDEKVFARLKSFFDQNINFRQNELVFMSFFRGALEHRPMPVVKESLAYLKKPAAYQELKRNLKNATVHVRHGDAIEYLKHTSDQYDWIDLSNILIYYYQYCSNISKDKYSTDLAILEQVWRERTLGSHPVMIFDYMFGVKKSELLRSLAQRKSKHFIEKLTIEIYAQTFDLLKQLFGEVKIMELAESASAMATKGPTDTLLYITK